MNGFMDYPGFETVDIVMVFVFLFVAALMFNPII